MAGTEQLLAGEGNCYYAGGGVFRAFIYHDEEDDGGRMRRVPYIISDELVVELIRQGFELLVSDDKERIIGSSKVFRTEPEKGPPSVWLKIGADDYELRLSTRGTGAARLRVYLPGTRQDQQIDMSEVEGMLGEEDA
jgi:hypothetical protein